MDGLTPRFQALPPEAPLAMPVQALDHAPPRPPRPASSPRLMPLRRLLVIGSAVVLTGFAAREMDKVLGVNGLTPLEIAILIVFVSLFAWIALSLASSLAGFVSLLRHGGQRLDAPLDPDQSAGPRVALLMPAYNEQPARIMAALSVIHADLARLGAATRFDIFILSDTTDPDAWIAEEAAFLALRAATPGARIYYRRRARNTERKAGNIADWVRRWGGAYPQFMILDADSVMTGECILRLAAAMARTPDAGLIQSLPVIVGAQTLFARMNQFAGRMYGPMIAHGIAWWHGSEGNYWGHNAMIRTRGLRRAPRDCRTLRGPQAVRRPHHEPRLHRGGADASRRLGGPHGALPCQAAIEESPPSHDRPRGARPALVSGQSAAHAAVLPAQAV